MTLADRHYSTVEMLTAGRPQPYKWCERGDVYKHVVAVHPGHSFCRDCLAWLRCETDDDPLGAPPAETKRYYGEAGL